MTDSSILLNGGGSGTGTGARGLPGPVGPQGRFSVEVYRTVTEGANTPTRPVGGFFNITTGTLSAPAGWSGNFTAPTDTSDVYAVRTEINPATQTGTITPVWSAPYEVGAEGPPGSAGITRFTDLEQTPSSLGTAGQFLRMGSTGSLIFGDVNFGQYLTSEDVRASFQGAAIVNGNLRLTARDGSYRDVSLPTESTNDFVGATLNGNTLRLLARDNTFVDVQLPAAEDVIHPIVMSRDMPSNLGAIAAASQGGNTGVWIVATGQSVDNSPSVTIRALSGGIADRNGNEISTSSQAANLVRLAGGTVVRVFSATDVRVVSGPAVTTSTPAPTPSEDIFYFGRSVTNSNFATFAASAQQTTVMAQQDITLVFPSDGYLVLAQPVGADDITQITIGGLHQIGAFTKVNSAFTESGTTYEAWVSNNELFSSAVNGNVLSITR